MRDPQAVRVTKAVVAGTSKAFNPASVEDVEIDNQPNYDPDGQGMSIITHPKMVANGAISSEIPPAPSYLSEKDKEKNAEKALELSPGLKLNPKHTPKAEPTPSSTPRPAPKPF